MFKLRKPTVKPYGDGVFVQYHKAEDKMINGIITPLRPKYVVVAISETFSGKDYIKVGMAVRPWNAIVENKHTKVTTIDEPSFGVFYDENTGIGYLFIASMEIRGYDDLGKEGEGWCWVNPEDEIKLPFSQKIITLDEPKKLRVPKIITK
jgi:co-chaperonin GroES (HSP10)